MNEALTIRTERVDDLPLLLAQMQRMGLARLLDEHFPTHGNRTGLSLGEVTTIWLVHILSQADHRMNHVQPWAERRLETLRGCRDSSLEVRDLADDRLADVLRHLSDDARWRAYRDRPATVRTSRQFSLSSQVEPDALARAIEQLGWRVYATNQATDGLSLPQAVEAYRDEYLVERNFVRLKGHPLSLSPCMSSAMTIRRAWCACCRLPCAS